MVVLCVRTLSRSDRRKLDDALTVRTRSPRKPSLGDGGVVTLPFCSSGSRLAAASRPAQMASEIVVLFGDFQSSVKHSTFWSQSSGGRLERVGLSVTWLGRTSITI